MNVFVRLSAAAVLGAAASVTAAGAAAPVALPAAATVHPARVTADTNTVPASVTNLPPIDFSNLPTGTMFTVQIHAFSSRDRAFAVYFELSKQVPSLQLMPPYGKDKLYRVCHGTFPTYDEAHAAAEKLRKDNIECFVRPVGSTNTAHAMKPEAR